MILFVLRGLGVMNGEKDPWLDDPYSYLNTVVRTVSGMSQLHDPFI